MKVKIGDTVYDPNVQPILFILSEQDKVNISMMLSTSMKYCCYPENYTAEQIREFMEIGENYDLIPVANTDVLRKDSDIETKSETENQ